MDLAHSWHRLMPMSWWSGVPELLMELLQTVQLTHVLMQEQYIFLYEVLLEGLLCSSTGIPVESIASHVHCLREAETSRHNNVLEKEFKVPPGSGALGLVLWGLVCGASPLLLPCPQQWDGDGGVFHISLGWLRKGRS